LREVLINNPVGRRINIRNEATMQPSEIPNEGSGTHHQTPPPEALFLDTRFHLVQDLQA
jgi:hypothetical protein